MLILNGIQFPTIHIHTPSLRNALTKSYHFLHYRSNSKVNKSALWVKGHNLRLVNPNDMGPKALVRGLQELSKMFKNMFILSKLSKICIGEVGKFLWICKSQLCSKHLVFANGPQISSWNFIHGLCTTHKASLNLFSYFLLINWIFNWF